MRFPFKILSTHKVDVYEKRLREYAGLTLWAHGYEETPERVSVLVDILKEFEQKPGDEAVAFAIELADHHTPVAKQSK